MLSILIQMDFFSCSRASVNIPGRFVVNMAAMNFSQVVAVLLRICILQRTVAYAQSPEAQMSEIDKHPAWESLETLECGESFADRIIGGVEATLGQYPWIARLGFSREDEADELEYKCGGALVNEWFVLTAAHCVVNLEPGLRLTTVRLGEHDIRTDPDCRAGVCAPPVQDFKVKRIVSHSKFNTPAFANDIALVELDHAAKITDFVAPVCLPRGPLILLPLLNEEVSVAGWGITNMSTMSEADVLQTLQLQVVPLSRCFEFVKSISVSDLQICAGGQKKKDSCAGDSGGPLLKVYDNDDGPRTYVVGLVSFGATLCGFSKPGIYTNISKFMHWILDHIIKSNTGTA